MLWLLEVIYEALADVFPGAQLDIQNKSIIFTLVDGRTYSLTLNKDN